jgi:hypothetical protein
MSVDAEVATAPQKSRRRLWILAAVVTVAVVAAALFLWRWSADPRDEQIDAAIRQVASAGGPAGWTPLQNPEDPAFPRNGSLENRDGLAVKVADGGFQTSWAAPPSESACTAMLAWAVKFVPGATDPPVDQCAKAKPASETTILGSGGSDESRDGRYMYYVTSGNQYDARTDKPAIVVTLVYRKPVGS